MSYFHPGLEVLRRALREEVAWRRGIRWFAGVDRWSPHFLGRRGSPPNVFYRPFDAVYMPNGNILVADRESHQVIEVTRDYKVVWEYGRLLDRAVLNLPEAVDYDDELGRVLISDTGNGRILEVDYRTRKVVNILSSTVAGPFGKPRAKYNRRTKNPMIADYEKHFVCEARWDGSIVWSRGTYGVPGTPAEGRLNRPMSVSYYHDWYPELVVISDYYNHLVYIYRPGVGVTRQFLVPFPVSAFAYGNIWGALSEFDRSVVFDSDGLLYATPFLGGNLLAFNPVEFTLLAQKHEQLLEFDLKSLTPRGLEIIPYTRYIVSDEPGSPVYYSFPAGGSFMTPFYAFGARRAVVYFKSSADATLEILVLRPSRSTADVIIETDRPTPVWEVYDSVSVAAGEFAKYIITQPNGVMAVRVTLAARGTANCWVNIE